MSHTFDHRNFMIFDVSELGLLDFNEVMESSPESLRRSINGSKTFVKWNNEKIRNSVSNLTTKLGPYNYEEMLQILSSREWS